MRSEEVWRRMSDQEVLVAAQQLDEYTEVGRQAILAEILRRGLQRSSTSTSSTPSSTATTLSAEMQRRVALLFSGEECEAATRLLVHLQEGFSETDEGAFGLERVQCAALRVSHGELRRLFKALEVGETDFRDLLSAAGFGSLHAHERWQPRPGRASRWERLRERLFGIR